MSFVFQLLVLFSFISKLNGQLEPVIRISEVLPNFSDRSFLEIKPVFSVTNSDLKYSVTIVYVERNRVKLHSIYELPGSHLEDEKFFTIGNHEFQPGFDKNRNIPIRPSDTSRIYGMANNWLDLTDTTYKAIIVTKATRSITMEWPEASCDPSKNYRGHCFNIEEFPLFKTYLISNQADAVILKHPGLVQDCPILDELFNKQLFANGPRYLDAPLGSQWPVPVSLNRCGQDQSWTTFDHSLYKGGTPSPGLSNDCTKRYWTPDIRNYVSLVPTRPPMPHPCGMKGDSDFKSISEEQIKSQELITDMLNTMTQIQPQQCYSRDLLQNNMADVLVPYKVGESKRMRLTPGENIEPVQVQEEVPEPVPEPVPELEANQGLEVDMQPEQEEESECVVDEDTEEEGDTTVNESKVDVSTLSPEDAELYVKAENSAKHIEKHQCKKLNHKEFLKHWRWIEYNEDTGKIKCPVCARYLKGSMHSNALSNENGYLNEDKRFNTLRMKTHETLYSHELAEQVKALRNANQQGSEIERTIKRNINPLNIVTNRHHQVVYHTMKVYNSFRAHSGTVNLLESLGMDMGPGCNNRAAAKRIAMSMARVFHQDKIFNLKHSSGPVWLVADGSEDVSKNHLVALMFVYLGKIFVNIRF